MSRSYNVNLVQGYHVVETYSTYKRVTRLMSIAEVQAHSSADTTSKKEYRNSNSDSSKELFTSYDFKGNNKRGNLYTREEIRSEQDEYNPSEKKHQQYFNQIMSFKTPLGRRVDVRA